MEIPPAYHEPEKHTSRNSPCERPISDFCPASEAQSIQNAWLSVQSAELGPPTPFPPLVPRVGDTLACEGGGGGTQFRRRETFWYSV
jgi:hypothetical protein